MSDYSPTGYEAVYLVNGDSFLDSMTPHVHTVKREGMGDRYEFRLPVIGYGDEGALVFNKRGEVVTVKDPSLREHGQFLGVRPVR